MLSSLSLQELLFLNDLLFSVSCSDFTPPGSAGTSYLSLGVYVALHVSCKMLFLRPETRTEFHNRRVPNKEEHGFPNDLVLRNGRAKTTSFFQQLSALSTLLPMNAFVFFPLLPSQL